ncbi:MAG TPA: BMP family ABC transporter substrate-binding protein [Steroidobacteraceae bacterium]|jgi:basic membrane protein A|nr:BMP family ABC transporter substrate-binding protein [Steroidobacteraceae bacterium]
MSHRLRPMLTTACLVALSAICSAASAPLKVAFVYVGPISDGGWSYQHHLGKLALDKEFGPRVQSSYVESVPETADAERVIRQLAAKGNDIIFTTSFGYMDPTLKVAKLFPKVKFEHASGYKTAPNMVAYEARFYEGAYLLGVLAGRTTRTNTLGFVGSFPISEVIRNIDAFTLGARSVNPKIHTKVVWVDTWYDPGKERQAAEALIAQGADVLCQNTDSPATVQVAEEKGLHAFGWDSDMAKYGPHAQLTANTENWGVYYIDEIRKVFDGSWSGDRKIKWGIKEGAVALTPLNPSVAADVAKLFESKKQAIAAGTLIPFAGPLKDNTGAPKVAAGSAMTVDELVSINWYVEGVDGTVPK